VAVFFSTQSGDFHDPATWGGIGVPDMGVDDVIIEDGHEVVVEADQYPSMWGGRLLVVLEGGTLRIQGGIDIANSTLWIEGVVIAEGSHLAVWDGSEMLIQSSGVLEVTSSFYLESSATATVEGLFYIDYGGYVDIYYEAIMTVESGAAWEVYGYCYLEDGSEAFLHGDLYVDNGGVLEIAYGGVLVVEMDGSANIYGTIPAYYGRIEVLGWFGLAEDGWMYLDYESLVNVYRDIRIGGRVMGYGGKIVMLRREGRIYDFNDNLLFVLDRAYGFGQARIA